MRTRKSSSINLCIYLLLPPLHDGGSHLLPLLLEGYGWPRLIRKRGGRGVGLGGVWNDDDALVFAEVVENQTI